MSLYNEKLSRLQKVYDEYKKIKENVPKAVSVVLLNKSNEVLSVSRKDDLKDFGLPGGKVDLEDVDMLDACVRELYEETGLLFNREDFIKIHEGSHGDYWQRTYYITKTLDSDMIFNYDEPHIVKWSKWEEVFNGSFGEYNEIIYNKLIDLIFV